MSKVITEIMEQYVLTGEIACGVLIVHKDGELVYKNKWGYTDVERKNSVKYNTIFRMASMTKVLTAVGIMKLYEQNKIRLDDVISTYLPSLAKMKVVLDGQSDGIENLQKNLIVGGSTLLDDVKTVQAERELTIRDLLTHSSGLEMGPYGLLFREALHDKEDTLSSRMDKLVKMALDFQPGTKTGYSPTVNFDLLARIIEIVSGIAFDVYMKKEIFEPLDMKDAVFHLSDEQKNRLVALYKLENGRLNNVSGTSEDIDEVGCIGSKYLSGAAGIYCTAEDYDHFTQMLCNGGLFNQNRILKQETVKMLYMERAYNQLQSEPGMEWGLGVMVRVDPEIGGSYASKGTFGWSGAFGTHFFVSPKEKLSATFAINRADIGGSSSYISKKVEEMVFSIWSDKN